MTTGLRRFYLQSSQGGDVYLSECVELGTSSFDETFEGAIAAAEEATVVYLESLIEEGQLEAVLQQKALQ